MGGVGGVGGWSWGSAGSERVCGGEGAPGGAGGGGGVRGGGGGGFGGGRAQSGCAAASVPRGGLGCAAGFGGGCDRGARWMVAVGRPLLGDCRASAIRVKGAPVPLRSTPASADADGP